ncbi:MAG: glycosyltransferase family 2 protein [Sphingobacteriales bacterium]|nr:glycosyltransferase family 2 protein [Sphingobacteriales bacterium]
MLTAKSLLLTASFFLNSFVYFCLKYNYLFLFVSFMDKTLSIIIPVYNEEQALPLVLPEIISFAQQRDYQLIMVNDGSKDRSLEILKAHSKKEAFFKIVNHKVNKGYGGAIKSGILAAETDYIITIDADGQHYLEDVNNLFDHQKQTDADMIIGSRKGLKEASIFRGIGKN